LFDLINPIITIFIVFVFICLDKFLIIKAK
jgi:hypothetical protein